MSHKPVVRTQMPPAKKVVGYSFTKNVVPDAPAPTMPKAVAPKTTTFDKKAPTRHHPR